MSILSDHPIIVALQEEPLVADGAMGTLLFNRGFETKGCFERLNLENRAAVEAVHLDYLRAGARLIRTNTFAANRFILAQHGLEDKVWDINVHGAKIARSARDISGVPAYVAGSIGPLGAIPVEEGEGLLTKEVATFKEQGEGLLAGGIDLFWVETISDARQGIAALIALREISKLPIALHFAFGPDGMTDAGQRPADIVALLQAHSVWPDILGVNCGAGPSHVLASLQDFIKAAPVHKLWSFLPNAGLPARVSGRQLFTTAPGYLAGLVPDFVVAGARVIGGCCGTDPTHTYALGQALASYLQGELENVKPAAYNAKVQEGAGINRFGTVRTAQEETGESLSLLNDAVDTPNDDLRNSFGNQFIISVELDPPKGANATRFLMAAERLRDAGVDAINVADSPMARVRMGAIPASHLIQLRSGVQVITHVTTRDRNLMGLQADLLGAHALGIRSILALTGDPPSLGNVQSASAVYDVDAIGLIRMANELNQGRDMTGNATGDPTDFLIGCALSPNSPDWELEKKRFKEKVAAGAHFGMTQPVYSREPLDKALNELGGSPLPLLVGVMPLHSYKHAQYLHNEVPGISIPEHVREALRKAGDQGLKVGFELSLELIEELRKDVAGIYVVLSFGKYEEVSNLVSQVKGLAIR